ncbi:MAG: hypothetical protein Q9O62_03030 [Ardenticatenia bacterium]|nr:hypothetical protein [Ardenticatenia bacterium]
MWIDLPGIALWDWDQRTWVDVEARWGLNTISTQGRRLVAPDGLVRLKVERSPAGGGPCMYVLLGARTGAQP